MSHRRGTYVPTILDKKMRAYERKHDVNWSAIACEAWRRVVEPDRGLEWTELRDAVQRDLESHGAVQTAQLARAILCLIDDRIERR